MFIFKKESATTRKVNSNLKTKKPELYVSNINRDFTSKILSLYSENQTNITLIKSPSFTEKNQKTLSF